MARHQEAGTSQVWRLNCAEVVHNGYLATPVKSEKIDCGGKAGAKSETDVLSGVSGELNPLYTLAVFGLAKIRGSQYTHERC